MPIWIELMVWLLIVYGTVLALALAWLSRRVRLKRLREQRAGKAKAVTRQVGRTEGDKSDG